MATHPLGLPGSVRPQRRPAGGALHARPIQPQPAWRSPSLPTSPASSSVSSAASSWRAREGSVSPSTSVEGVDADELGHKLDPESKLLNATPQPRQDYVIGSLWSRVAAAAGNISINVTKAWEHGGIVDDEPRTADGQESRLTIAMKHFYLERAKDIRDLPDWLFSDRERQITTRAMPSDRELYAEVIPGPSARTNAPPLQAAPTPRMEYDEEARPSRARTKLKAMADARRGPGRVSDNGAGKDPMPAQRRMVGLPSAPGSTR